MNYLNEKYIPMAIVLSVVFKRIVLTVHGVHFRSPKWNYFTRSVFWIVDVLGSFFVKRLVHCSEYDKKTFEKITFFRQTYFVFLYIIDILQSIETALLNTRSLHLPSTFTLCPLTI